MTAAPRRAPLPRGAAWTRPGVVAATIVLAIAASYHNSVSGAWLLDDTASVLENPTIRNLADLGAVLSPPIGAGVGGRPLANLTFALNHALTGLRPEGFHVANIALHAAAALALFGVARRTLLGPGLHARFAPVATPLGATIALFWALHPLQTAAVDYISQRTEVLMGLCYLVTLYAFVRSTDSPARGWRWLAWTACAAGMASKEVMVTAPLIVLLYDRTFIAGSWREAWRQRWRIHAALVSTWLLLGWLMTSSTLGERGVGFGGGVSTLTYALTECRALVIYLGRAVWPHPLVFDYGWAFDAGAAAAPYVLASLVLVAVTALGVWRRPALGFLGAWCLLILAPTSSVIPIVQQPIAESRMYLPLAGLVGLAVVGGHACGTRRSWWVFGLAALGFATVTLARNRTYADALVLWTDTVAKAPSNARARAQLAGALLRANRPAEALPAGESAVKLAPSYPDAHTNLGAALLANGRLNEALLHFETALALMPGGGTADALCNRADVLFRVGRIDEAIAHYERALVLDPQHPKAHNDLSAALLPTGRVAEAIAHAEAALRGQPDFPAAHYNLGNAFAAAGRAAEAMSQYQAALRLQPDFPAAHCNLGVALFRSNRFAEAAAQFEQALRLRPDYPEAQRNLAATRGRLGR